MEEIEQLEKQRQAQLEEERKRAEQEKNEETPGKYLAVCIMKRDMCSLNPPI